MEIVFLQLMVGLVFAIVTAVIASNRGRNAVGWFFFGLFAGWIALVVVLVMPNLREQNSYRERVNLENMRLREQIRQERMKSESFRLNTSARLDAHDEHLGVDTRQALPQPESYGPGLLENRSGGEQFQQVADAADGFTGPQPIASERQWYYEQQGETCGPVSESQLQAMAQNGHVSGENLVWTEGMTDWARADAVPTFQPLIQRS